MLYNQWEPIMKLYAILPFVLQGTLWWIVMKPLFLFFGHLKVEGYEHIKHFDDPLIFAPNHSHSVDAVLLPLTFPLWSKFSPMFYVARKAKFYTGWRKMAFSLFNLNFIGSFPIEPGKRNYAESLRKHILILQGGGNMCIFPEGGITRDGKIRSAHGGVTYLALTTKRPVAPVLIEGTFGLSLKDFLSRKRHIKITFFQPLFLHVQYTGEETRPAHYGAIGEEVLDILREARSDHR